MAGLVEGAGRKCVLVPGDLADPAHCRAVIDCAAAEFGGIDVLVSNAAFQMTHSDLGEDQRRGVGLHVLAQCRVILPG